jgi:hypothetical protein
MVWNLDALVVCDTKGARLTQFDTEGIEELAKLLESRHTDARARLIMELGAESFVEHPPR